MSKKIVIIGAGPTGLGAGFRLKELNHENFVIYEKDNCVGGLSKTIYEDGNMYDLGGHVLFSNYKYFNEKILPLANQVRKTRVAEIFIDDKLIPYPFQNNIHYLDTDKVVECIMGLINNDYKDKTVDNFYTWIEKVFGKGIAKYFMVPYNEKVWATPLHYMNKDWIAERVSVINIEQIIKNTVENNKDHTWGPNNYFDYPHNGIGDLFEKIADNFREKIKFNKEIVKIDEDKKIIYFADGTYDIYDALINTMPMNLLGEKLQNNNKPRPWRQELLHNGSLITYVQLDTIVDKDKKWIYYPNVDSFHRVVFQSNYSSIATTLDHSLLLVETSYSNIKYPYYNIKTDEIKNDLETHNNNILRDLEKVGLLKGNVVKIKNFDMPYAYPVPTIGRNSFIQKMVEYTENKDIYTRGRFGLWKYEYGNMDHSVMQGVEVIDKILMNHPTML